MGVCGQVGRYVGCHLRVNIDGYIRIGGLGCMWGCICVCRDVRVYVGMYACRDEYRHVLLEVCGLSHTCGRRYVGMLRGSQYEGITIRSGWLQIPLLIGSLEIWVGFDTYYVCYLDLHCIASSAIYL